MGWGHPFWPLCCSMFGGGVFGGWQARAVRGNRNREASPASSNPFQRLHPAVRRGPSPGTCADASPGTPGPPVPKVGAQEASPPFDARAHCFPSLPYRNRRTDPNATILHLHRTSLPTLPSCMPCPSLPLSLLSPSLPPISPPPPPLPFRVRSLPRPPGSGWMARRWWWWTPREGLGGARAGGAEGGGGGLSRGGRT